MEPSKYLQSLFTFNGVSDWKQFIAERMSCRPTKEIMHSFKGFGIHDSVVRLNIWEYAWGNIVAVIETGKGTSVTNAAEQIINEVKDKYLPRDRNTIWLEHYPDNGSVDIIQPTYNDVGRCIRAGWVHFGLIIK